MPYMSIIAAVAPSVIGGLLGGSKGSNSATSTQQNQIDPRMVPYLYGANGNSGLLGGANNTYQQQMAQGGLNPMQNAGLELQRQSLMDPAYTQSYGQMRNMGESLLGQGMAGNPFSSGQAQPGMPQPNMPQPMNAGHAPAFGAMQALGLNGTSAAYQPIVQQQAAQQAQQPDIQALIDQMLQKYAPAARTPENDYGTRG